MRLLKNAIRYIIETALVVVVAYFLMDYAKEEGAMQYVKYASTTGATMKYTRHKGNIIVWLEGKTVYHSHRDEPLRHNENSSISK